MTFVDVPTLPSPPDKFTPMLYGAPRLLPYNLRALSTGGRFTKLSTPRWPNITAIIASEIAT
jgi:hypothetical protein